MKLIFTAVIALCTVAATFADEGKFGPAWVEAHNYKVPHGQLGSRSDTAPTSSFAQMPARFRTINPFELK
jgi:hypothetical protein